MTQFLSLKWWGNQFITVFITLLVIYLIKKIAGTVNIPVVSEVANAV